MYFYEDEVYRITKKGNLEFGMVLQNADVDTDEEESGSEEMEKLKNGHILVAWHPRGEEDVIHEKKVCCLQKSSVFVWLASHVLPYLSHRNVT